MANAGLQYITGGRAWGILDRDHQEAGHEAMQKLSAYGYHGDDVAQRYQDLRFDGQLTFNKVTDVYHAAVAHDERSTGAPARARHKYLRDALC